jgi:glycosyltransferase EpsD
MPGGSMKVLYCASVTSHLKNFHLPHIKWLSENGCEVTTLTDDGERLPCTVDAKGISFVRSLFSPHNIKAIFQASRILNYHHYDLVITNTTLARIVMGAAVKLLDRKQRPFLLNICHGFPFHANEAKKKWLYLGSEKLIANATDLLVVMNREDEFIANKYKLGRNIMFAHGMGVDGASFKPDPYAGKLSGFTFLCIADFSKRKNQAMLIRAFAKAAGEMPKATLAFAGAGATLAQCRRLAEKLNISRRVKFLGHVSSIAQLIPECDAIVSASAYEGLPFNIVEAMLCGLPVIARDIKGHRDLLLGTAGRLFITERDLENLLKAVYGNGRRQAAYPNAWQYTLAGVQDEWRNIFAKALAGAGR